MRYQFFVDGRPAAPVRATWEEAAKDGVDAGYAMWGCDRVSIKINSQAEIERIND